MRLLAFTLLLVCASARAYSQFNYYKLTASARVGPTLSYGDLPGSGLGYAWCTIAGYRPTPYTLAQLELQTGILSGAENNGYRFFRNGYRSVSGQFQLELRQFRPIREVRLLAPLRLLNIGAGAGVLFNRQRDIARTVATGGGRTYSYPGPDRSTELVLPVSAGAIVHFRDFWGWRRFSVGVLYQHHFTFGEGLDGYNDPPQLFSNRHADSYGLWSVSATWNFGFIGLGF